MYGLYAKMSPSKTSMLEGTIGDDSQISFLPGNIELVLRKSCKIKKMASEILQIFHMGNEHLVI